MTLRSEYTEIVVEEGLLPQILRELLAMAQDPNDVEVTDGQDGRVIYAHPELAEAWYQDALQRNDDTGKEAANEEVDAPIFANGEVEVATIASEDIANVVPMKRGPGRPRKVVPPPLSEESAS